MYSDTYTAVAAICVVTEQSVCLTVKLLVFIIRFREFFVALFGRVRTHCFAY